MGRAFHWNGHLFLYSLDIRFGLREVVGSYKAYTEDRRCQHAWGVQVNSGWSENRLQPELYAYGNVMLPLNITLLLEKFMYVSFCAFFASVLWLFYTWVDLTWYCLDTRKVFFFFFVIWICCCDQDGAISFPSCLWSSYEGGHKEGSIVQIGEGNGMIDTSAKIWFIRLC